jgi:hypothetical protein
MITTDTGKERFEISARFRRSIEARIARLEQDAANDQAQLGKLADSDHICRHMRLVAVQRAEALRMRSFLATTRPRKPRPMMAL